MPTDEDDQDDHFLFSHHEKATSPPRRAKSLLLLFRSDPPLGWGGIVGNCNSNHVFIRPGCSRRPSAGNSAAQALILLLRGFQNHYPLSPRATFTRNCRTWVRFPYLTPIERQNASAFRIISSEVPPASPLLRDGTSDQMFERMSGAV